ncbi:hypothetical protein JCM17380_16650 [Desulfosporosinus burensis]
MIRIKKITVIVLAVLTISDNSFYDSVTLRAGSYFLYQKKVALHRVLGMTLT